MKIPTKAVAEDLPEMTVKSEDITFIKHLPACPQCKGIEGVYYFNVTNKTYECRGCNIRFRIAGKKGLSFWKRDKG